MKNKPHISYQDRVLQHKINKTRIFIKNNPNLLITRADKGNITVAIDRNTYIKKVESSLLDENLYKKQLKNPLPKLKEKAKHLLDLWDQKGVFKLDPSFDYINLTTDNTTLSRAYGLIKVHKKDQPVRIIVPSINTPAYSLDKCLSKLFTTHLKKPQSTVKNSYEILNILKNSPIPDNYKLMSLDVVAMFPSLPHSLILQAVANKWKFLKNTIYTLTKEEFLNGIKLLLESTYLQFNSKFYHQVTGAPMGYCSSPWFADITIEALEINCLEKLKSSAALLVSEKNPQIKRIQHSLTMTKRNVLIFKRFADDCFIVAKTDILDNLLTLFNSVHPSLQFTMETEQNKKLNFLDLEITRIDNNFAKTNWYKKPTFSGRYLNYHSHHPLSQKIGIVYSITDKCIKLSNPEFHSKNLKEAKNILINNDYPVQFINKYVNIRVKMLNNNTPKNTIKQQTLLRNKKVIIPFFKNLTENINYNLKQNNILPINKITNKFNSLITLGKDKLNKFDNKNVVYKIGCQDCDSIYIGQTSQLLKNRSSQHRNCVKNRDSKSALANHVIDTGHTIDFNNIKILDIEPHKKIREFSEMLHIHTHKNTLNRTEDTQFLKNIYKSFTDNTNFH